MEFNYYYGEEADQFSFIRIPKLMLTEKRFATISLSAKILYGLLLDRMSLSVKNGWLDEEKRVFIIFKIEEIMEILGFSKKKSIEYLNELETFGLVEKKRRGLGLPSILYIKSFMLPDMEESYESGTSRSVEIDTSVSEDDDTDNGTEASEITRIVAENPENTEKMGEDKGKNGRNDAKEDKKQSEFCVRGVDLGTSRGVEIALQEVSIREPQEVSKCAPLMNNTKENNNNMSNTESDLISSAAIGNNIVPGSDRGSAEIDFDSYADYIRQNLEIDTLIKRSPYDAEILEGIYEMVLETVLSRNDSMVIDSNKYPMNLVRSKFMKLNSSHVEYVIDMLKDNTSKIRNIKKYVLTCLFNAPTTIGCYYRAEVNYDMANG